MSTDCKFNCITAKFIFVSLTIVCLLTESVSPFISGSTAACSNEGERVYPFIANDTCISCFCKNKEVICEKESCNTRGCFTILEGSGDKCCRSKVCKGCVYDGEHRKSGSQWADKDDPCTIFSCKAGVLTKSKQQCYTPCQHPSPPRAGECCKSCNGCDFNDVRYKEGDVVHLEQDRCVTCSCQEGSMICKKESCQVLACPENKTMIQPGACCPECNGSRSVFEVKDKCLFGTKVYKNRDKLHVDRCTHCECQNSTMMCDRETCPATLCRPEHRIVEDGKCCPRCQRDERKSHCVSAGKEYQEGQTWKLDTCTNCDCRHGEVRCYVEQCRPAGTMECPPRYTLQKLAGVCCPQCVEDDAACTVYGDPHYQSFDGREFTFQGPCKYILTEDCKGKKSFAVRVRNDPRSSKLYSWTKTVFFQIGKTKVILAQKGRVKVNRKPVLLPYQKPDVLTVVQEGYNIIVRTSIGVRLIWDGDSFIEVSVPPIFKSQLCGLCGNYDGNVTDDFRIKGGKMAGNESEFGAAWRVGGAKQCARQEPVQPRESGCQDLQANQLCHFLRNKSFAACRRKVNSDRYYNSCIMDMCQCPPNRKCYCESLTAYAHECSNAGIMVDWRNATGCTTNIVSPPTLSRELKRRRNRKRKGKQRKDDILKRPINGIRIRTVGQILKKAARCPKGAIYKECGSACIETCANRSVYQKCLKPCIPSCQCRPGTVWYWDKCIKPRRCPSSS